MTLKMLLPVLPQLFTVTRYDREKRECVVLHFDKDNELDKEFFEFIGDDYKVSKMCCHDDEFCVDVEWRD